MRTRHTRVRSNFGHEGSALPVFGLGCFWGAESIFGALPGVLRTRVGYAGGTTEDPTHRRIGDHFEVVEVKYDPLRLTFAELLAHFFSKHDATRNPAERKWQYRSVIGCEPSLRDLAQEAIAAESSRCGREVHTMLIEPQPFFLAETHHQKWHLRRVEVVWDALLAHFGDDWIAIDSTIAARLNGYVRGHGSRSQLRADLARWPLSLEARRALYQAYDPNEVTPNV